MTISTIRGSLKAKFLKRLSPLGSHDIDCATSRSPFPSSRLIGTKFSVCQDKAVTRIVLFHVKVDLRQDLLIFPAIFCDNAIAQCVTPTSMTLSGCRRSDLGKS
ncbi:hypothetical protein AJ78_01940 [Emergomyces pasteurianus Ep9510]|uniref:Uncharacterized protein n=1 Tax=Emergomyces pasteurianus Ep9510 TaxID=1447872 RepID=A0A1J9QP71_9EURO|nr:hypothetical protein AJ78_01940 [Emergomyces pasteurianus Ep9510]